MCGVGQHCLSQDPDQVFGCITSGHQPIQMGGLAAQKGGFFNQRHLDAAPGQVQGGPQPGDTAADHRCMTRRIDPDGFQGLQLFGLGHGCRHQL